MKHLFGTLGVFLVFAGLVHAADRPESAPGDLSRLQGRWCAQAGPRRDIAVTLRVEGKQVRVEIAMRNGLSFQVRGELKVNEAVTPRALDWVHFQDAESQDLPDILAIYEIVGDRFRVCNGGPHNRRPSEFKDGEGILASVVTFERERPAASP
jgi:uncharacterized protein (TIGR03067 family)